MGARHARRAAMPLAPRLPRLALAGMLAILVFHQGLQGLAYWGGVLPGGPYNLTPVPPFGLPRLVSLLAWGALWALPVGLAVRPLRWWLQVPVAMGLGAALPTLFTWLVVLPMRGLPATSTVLALGATLFAAWGLGLVLFMRLLRVR